MPMTRRGQTLVELVVTLVLLAVVLGLVADTLARQQRLARGTTEQAAVRAQLRQAATVLPASLRALSPRAGDLQAISDTMVQLALTLGTAVLCAGSPGAFVVTPLETANPGLTSWQQVPRRGDSVFVLVRADAARDEDGWAHLAIDSVGTQGTACDAFLDPAERASALQRWRFAVAPGTPLPVTAGLGTPVRFARPVRWRFYRAGDGAWYLGQQQYVDGGWETTQPVAGPFRAHRADGTSGLRFTFADTAGTALVARDSAARAAVARIDVAIAGTGVLPVNAATARGARFTDSLLLRIALRNRE